MDWNDTKDKSSNRKMYMRIRNFHVTYVEVHRDFTILGGTVDHPRK